MNNFELISGTIQEKICDSISLYQSIEALTAAPFKCDFIPPSHIPIAKKTGLDTFSSSKLDYMEGV